MILVQISPHDPTLAVIQINSENANETLGQLIRDALSEFGFTFEQYGDHVAIYTYDAAPDTEPVLGGVATRLNRRGDPVDKPWVRWFTSERKAQDWADTLKWWHLTKDSGMWCVELMDGPPA